ncbi:alpha/beta fold hydrolase [Gemmatimonas sp.]
MPNGFTRITSVPLFTRVDGVGDPLLLLHGGPGAHHDYLYPQMLALAEQHRVYTYDQRGGGQSKTDDPTPVTWRTQVDDLAQVIREFGLVPPTVPGPTIVGYSWGALLAMLYAIQCTTDPSLVPPARLVLISPAPITRAWRDMFEAELAARGRGEIIQGLREALAASGLRESDPAAYRQRSFELSVAGYFANPARATDLTPFRVTGKVQQSVWQSLGDFDLSVPLRAVNVPTLVLHGNDDPIPLASATAAADALGAELVVLPECGHVPYVERPSELFTAIEQFLVATS